MTAPDACPRCGSRNVKVRANPEFTGMTLPEAAQSGLPTWCCECRGCMYKWDAWDDGRTRSAQDLFDDVVKHTKGIGSKPYKGVNRYRVLLGFDTLGDDLETALQNAQEVVHDINRRAAIELEIDEIRRVNE